MFYKDWGQRWTASALPGNDRGFEGRERGRGAERRDENNFFKVG